MTAMFIVLMFDCRRGREGLVDLRKDTWQKRYNEFHKVHFFQKVRGELSKNHRKDKVCSYTSFILPNMFLHMAPSTFVMLLNWQ